MAFLRSCLACVEGCLIKQVVDEMLGSGTACALDRYDGRGMAGHWFGLCRVTCGE